MKGVYMSDHSNNQNTSNTYSIIAFVLGGISFLLVPILFGAASIIVAMIAKNKKERLANIALAVGILGLVLGMVLGALIGAISA
jgi:uncharacterized protein YacL